jgi:hypothetical protein
MHIRWILSAEGVTGPVLPWASYRYRAKIPMRALAARGHACDVHALRRGESVEAAIGGADVLVFAKNHTEPDEVVALLELARTRGVATVVDTCDDYFSADNPYEPYYRRLVTLATLVTTSSFQLAGAIEDAVDVEAHVVRDPYEGERGEPRWNADPAGVRALWFGTPQNLHGLLDEAAELPQRISGYRLEIDVLTRETRGLPEAIDALNAAAPGKLALRFCEWSLQTNWDMLRECDLGFIPIRRTERFFRAKGPNRLIETLWAGRFAVTNSIPAYEEFRRWAWIGDDLGAGIAWALRNPDDVLSRIAAAQAYIAERYSPQAIAVEWESALAEAAARVRTPH